MSLAVAVDAGCRHVPPITDGERTLLNDAQAWLDAHRDEFVALLGRWVAIPSISDESLDAGRCPMGAKVDLMFRQATDDLTRLGLAVEQHDGYAISLALDHGRYVVDGPVGGDEEIGMVGHLDVVPAGEGWKHEPFRLELDDQGFAFGRGVADCKGPSLTDVWVLRMMHDLHVPMRHRLRVILGGGEETTMNDIRGYLRRWQAPGFSLVTDGPFPVNYGQKGILQLELSLPAPGMWAGWRAGSAGNAVPGEAQIMLDGIAEQDVRAAIERCCEPYRSRITCVATDGGVLVHARGEAGHAAFQSGTLNAIGLLSGFLADEHGLLSKQGRQAELATAQAMHTITSATDGVGLGIGCSDESGALSFNLGMVGPMEGGRIVLTCDIRYPVGQQGATIVGRLRDTIAGFPGQWVVRLDHVHDEPAYRIDPNGDEAVTLAGAFDAFFHTSKPPFTMGGGTHSRLLPKSVTFGADFWYMDDIAAATGKPGKPAGMDENHGGAHAADECVNIDHLMTAAQLYMLALTRLDAVLTR